MPRFQTENLLNAMDKIKWDTKDMPIEHNPYVNDCLKEFRTFSSKIVETKMLSAEQVCFLLSPSNLTCLQKKLLWDCAGQLISETFVEGFSRAKKCSNEGRAMMSLDWLTLNSALSKLSPVKYTLAHCYLVLLTARRIKREFVENYIKAWYEEDVNAWCQLHPVCA
jgi:hypothetical protein